MRCDVGGWLVCMIYAGCTGCGGGVCFFFQAEDGIRDLVRSRGLGDVYKRQARQLRVRLIVAGSADMTRPRID